MALSDVYADEFVGTITISGTNDVQKNKARLALVETRLNAQNAGSVVDRDTSETTYQISSVSKDGTAIGTTDIVKIPYNGSVTLTVSTTSGSASTKYYAVIQGGYYEITLADSKLSLGSVKTLEEINQGIISPSANLNATFTAGTGSSAVIGTPMYNQDNKTITIAGNENIANVGPGTLSITYGNSEAKVINVKVVGTYTVNLYANKTKATQTTPEIFRTLTVLEDESAFNVTGTNGYAEPAANTDEEFIGWKNVTEDTDAIVALTTVTGNLDVYATYGMVPPPIFGVVDSSLQSYFGMDVNTKNSTTAEVSPTGGSDEWQLFYADTSNIYLIYKDYYPNSALPTDLPKYISKVSNRSYAVKATLSRKTLINYLNKKLNWTTVSTAFNDKFNVNSITATGAPTIDMFVTSWNNNKNPEMTSLDKSTIENWNGYANLVASPMSSAQSDGLNGYYIFASGDSNETQTYRNITSNFLTNTVYPGSGNSNMYFPNTATIDTDCDGYWLASPSANTDVSEMIVGCVGYMNGYLYNGGVCSGAGFNSTRFCTRPVVSIPRYDVNINVDTSGSTPVLTLYKVTTD